jgi:hypothetical protein
MSTVPKIPEWATTGEFFSVVKTAEELSVICAVERVPCETEAVSGWRAIKVVGPLDLTLVGIFAALSGPLAKAGVSIFAVSTFDTDYLLVKED